MSSYVVYVTSDSFALCSSTSLKRSLFIPMQGFYQDEVTPNVESHNFTTGSSPQM